VPIYMEISRLHRTVTIVARGKMSPDEVLGAAQRLLDAHVPEFAKLIDVAGATSEVSPEQIQRIAAMLRGSPGEKRGPVAFLVEATRGEFARAFAATQGERPVKLFTNLRDARAWLENPGHVPDAPAAPAEWPATSTPWSDPRRQAVMIRGNRHRGVPVGGRASYAMR
jgi:hypothetical protein